MGVARSAMKIALATGCAIFLFAWAVAIAGASVGQWAIVKQEAEE